MNFQFVPSNFGQSTPFHAIPTSPTHFSDKLRSAFHYGISATLLTAGLVTGGVTLPCLFAAASIQISIIKEIIPFLLDELKEETKKASREDIYLADGNVQLERISGQISRAFGKTTAPELRLQKENATDEKSLLSFKGLANAASVLGVQDSGFTLPTESLLRTLNDNEEIAVLAHEVAHSSAEHSRKKISILAAQNTAYMAAGLSFVASFIAPIESFSVLGVLGCVKWSALGTFCCAKWIEGGFNDAAKTLVERGRADHWFVRAFHKKAPASKVTSFSGSLLAAAISCYLGAPEVAGAWAVMRLFKAGCALNRSRLSRANEYQADRAATQVTGLGEELISALDKIETYNKKRMKENPETFGCSLNELGPINRSLGKIQKRLFSTHPSTPERAKAIRRHMAEMKKSAVISL